MKRALIVATMVAICLSGCAITSPVGPNSNKTIDPTSATSMAKHIQSKVPEVTETTALTASTDPAHQLGKSGQYTKAVVLDDSRAKCASMTPRCGAELLIWPTLDAAAAYARSTGVSSRVLTHGQGTLEVANTLPATAVEQYKKAWDSYFTP